MVGVVATMAACLVWLGVGVVAHRSSRHRLAGAGAGSAVAVAVMLLESAPDRRCWQADDDATPGRVLMRDKQVAVDYSGVGLRKRSATPSPVPMHEIRSASVQEISVPRDIGGWGDVTAPDGRQGWITRSGEALVVHRHDKPDFVFTLTVPRRPPPS